MDRRTWKMTTRRKVTTRRSQSPHRFRSFRTFTVLSNRAARSLTDVTLACHVSPSISPDLLEIDGDSHTGTDGVHKHCDMSKDNLQLSFRTRSTTISDTSPTTYLNLHQKLQDKRPPVYPGKLSQYLKVEEIPEIVHRTTSEELRYCHDYMRHVVVKTMESQRSPHPASQKLNGNGENGDGSDIAAPISCNDGVFSEDDRTPVPSPDREIVHSTPIRNYRTLYQSPSMPPKPDVLFHEHEVTISPDSYGYGLVLSGSRPCYVSSVEILGPAHRVGVCVGDFVLNANGIDVLNSDHEEISRIILQETSTAHLVVMSQRDAKYPIRPTVLNHPSGCSELNQHRSANGSFVSSAGFDSYASRMTEESCVATDSFSRPRNLLLEDSGGLVHAGVVDIPQTRLKRNKSRGSLQSQSAPVSPADRDEKLSGTLLSLTQCAAAATTDTTSVT